MTTLQSLKDSLTTELSSSELDYGKVLALASEIAKRDEKNVRFSIDASHVYRLGIELVSKQETAVAELIKNAYDADATQVHLRFKDSTTKGGTLEITDDGEGMSREKLVNGFMRISTQEKFDSPTSKLFERQRAGRKGIGRFAAQRLGTKLIVSTQEEASNFSLRIEVDWDDFEGGKDLSLISNQISVCPKRETKGTVLEIINLRDAWSEAQIQRTFRFVSELLQPFPLSARGVSSGPVDPGFKVVFTRRQNGTDEIVASEEQSIFSHAFAAISAKVDVKGDPLLTVRSEKYQIDIKDQKIIFDPRLKSKNGLPNYNFSLLTGVSFTAYYFIADELPTGTKALVREVLNRQGGVRIYRNGFRVMPYGEAYDDWLGLQRSSALREVLPPHNNSNFLGFVEIRDVSGVRFEETASREGLIENEAFSQLQDFVYRSLLSGVIELAQARNKKTFSGKDKQKPTNAQSPQEKASAVAAHLRSAAAAAASAAAGKSQSEPPNAPETNGAGDTPSSPLDPEDLNSLADAVENLGLESQAALEENGMLRVLASLGLTIGEFTHEVRHTIAALSATTSLMVSKIGSDNPLYKAGESMRENMELLRSYVRYFDNAVIQNAHRELEVHELRDLISEFSEVVKPTLDRQNITIETKYIGYDLFARPMHKSEWASILLNLFTNSMKAISRAGEKGKILIVAGTMDDNLFVEFSDNGDGIPIGDREKIFDAFFTTSAPAHVMSPDSEKLMGTGLGMKIVKDIVEAVNGDIEVVDPQPGYKTCIRIEVPKAKDEEVGDARY